MSDRHVPSALRRSVERRAAGRCEYCLTPRAFSASGFCVEHIRPRKQGGPTALENLALACAGCNGHKADKTHASDPATGRHTRLYHPRSDAWRRHFRWSSGGLTIEGITAVGRATIAALLLNRTPLVNLRRILALEGRHPPVA